jgi:hypothetical protein
MTIVHDTIAVELAKLQRIVPVPTEPFGYGKDLDCVTDLTDNWDEVDPFTVRAIGQAIVRRLTTRRGQLRDDPDYGHDIRQYLHGAQTASDILDAQGETLSEITKDDRVDDAVVTVAIEAGRSMRVTINITPVDARLGPFTLTLAVTSGAVLLEAIA